MKRTPSDMLALIEYNDGLRARMKSLPIIYNSEGRRLMPSEIDPRNYVTPTYKP